MNAEESAPLLNFASIWFQVIGFRRYGRRYWNNGNERVLNGHLIVGVYEVVA